MNIYYVYISKLERKKPYNKPLSQRFKKRKHFNIKEWVGSWRICGNIKIFIS
jgi:hypothetical protein|uniref:Uncharacterized protein n=1 Tax=viral metagenome TaxID=1070528 RepID=A0A6C0DUE5_9ZZZZ